jgi:hypothetical protein
LGVPIFSVPEFVAREKRVPDCEGVDVDGGGEWRVQREADDPAIIRSRVEKEEKRLYC